MLSELEVLGCAKEQGQGYGALQGKPEYRVCTHGGVSQRVDVAIPKLQQEFPQHLESLVDVHLSVHPSIPSRSSHTWSWDALLVGHLKMGL